MAIQFDETTDYYTFSSPLVLPASTDWAIVIYTYVADNTGSDNQYLLSGQAAGGAFGAGSFQLRLREASAGTENWLLSIVDDSSVTAVNSGSSSAPGGDSTGRWIVVQSNTTSDNIEMWFCETGGTASRVINTGAANSDTVTPTSFYLGRLSSSASSTYLYGGIAAELYFISGNILTQAQIESIADGDPFHVATSLTPDLYVQMDGLDEGGDYLRNAYGDDYLTASGSPTSATHPTINAANTYYVDTAGNDSNDGSSGSPWLTIEKANQNLQPGDTVIVDAGTYTDPIQPDYAGVYGRPITYQIDTGDTVTIQPGAGDNCIVAAFDGRGDYITIDGFVFDQENANHRWCIAAGDTTVQSLGLVIQNCNFTNGESGTYTNTGVSILNYDYATFQNNTVENWAGFLSGGGDNTQFRLCNYTLIDNNTFYSGPHGGLAIRGTSNSIISNNELIGTYARCSLQQEYSGTISQRNVWTHNVFRDSIVAADGNDGDGIQLAGDDCIVRYNRFYNLKGPGINPDTFDPGALSTQDNRIYNNVFYDCEEGGVELRHQSTGTTTIAGNDFLNNAFYKNIFNQSASTPYSIFVRGNVSGDWETSTFYNNNILYTTTGQDVINHDTDGDGTLAAFETSDPTVFYDNIEVLPLFVNEDTNDFRIYDTSLMIDAGAFLTQANGAGISSVTLIVDDASFFHDGFGIATADTIVIGSTEAVLINSINYATNTITLSESRTWSNNDNVSLEYEGTAPNIGAYESSISPVPELIADFITPLEFFLIPQPKETVFTGIVDSTPSSPYVSVSYNTGVTGSFGAPLPGQTVEIVNRGKRRLKAWSGGAAGTITIDESDDVGPIIQAGDTIRIYNQFRLWPKFPRFVQSVANVTIYADYDEAYTNQTNQWRPVAVAGPPAVEFLSGGTITVSFVGDRSYALAAGASITNYLWTARDSAEGTSTSQGTEGSPVTFTWTSPGWYLVSLQVTDSNGNTHTNYTYVVIIDPASPEDVAFVDFDTTSDNFDFDQGGGSCSFTVRGDASETTFPEEALIIHACRGTQTTTTGSWPFRANTLFTGWIMHDSVRQNPETGEVSFRAATIDAVMKNLSMFPVSLTDRTTPTDWTQAKNLTVDRAFSFLAKYWSTLDLMTSIVPTNDTRLIKRQDFGPTSLYAMLQSELIGSILGKMVSSHQGVLYTEIDYNVQNSTERASVTTRKTLHKGIWYNDVFVEERADYEWPARQVKMSGIYYNGGEAEDICPLFSEAPGDAPKSYGREMNFDRLILSGQTDLNVRCGHMLEKLNQRYPSYRMSFFNDGSFATVPQELFPATIESGDNDRALAISKNLIPRRISRRYDHQNGYYEINVEFEPETSGAAGVTVDIPCGPPEQKLPSNTPPPAPPSIQGITALIAGTTGTSYYFTPAIAQTWERRVNGLVDPDQLVFEDVIPDNWGTFKQGYNPESVIVWGSGPGFLVRSTDSGKNWKDRTPYLTAPAWDGESGTVANTTLMRLNDDIFVEDRLYVLARWQDSGNWRGAVGKTSDGFDYTWHNLTGSSQSRPLGMSVDRGNGATLWITTWENSEEIYLNKINISDMTLTARYELGGATSAEIDAQTWYAHPFNRLGQTDEVFVFGRMNNPQELSGTVHILMNDTGGVTGGYSVIERQWGADICGSFGADGNNYMYAVRNGS